MKNQFVAKDDLEDFLILAAPIIAIACLASQLIALILDKILA
jgi:hypothetical protein